MTYIDDFGRVVVVRNWSIRDGWFLRNGFALSMLGVMAFWTIVILLAVWM